MLNTEHYVLIAGNPEKWDNETLDACGSDRKKNADPRNAGRDRDRDLCSMQRSQMARGRQGASLCRTIHGWTVRDDSGLTGWAILYRDKSFIDAMTWGIQWAMKDPDKREFSCSMFDFGEPVVGIDAAKANPEARDAQNPTVIAWNLTGAVGIYYQEDGEAMARKIMDSGFGMDRIVVVGPRYDITKRDRSEYHCIDGEWVQVRKMREAA